MDPDELSDTALLLNDILTAAGKQLTLSIRRIERRDKAVTFYEWVTSLQYVRTAESGAMRSETVKARGAGTLVGALTELHSRMPDGPG